MTPRRAASRGFTLFEALVVLVITGLIAAVLVQSMGAVLAGRNAVAAKILDLDRLIVERNLMLTPLTGVALDQNRLTPRKFQGEGRALSGLTLTPLGRPAGVPTDFRMYFDNAGGMTALMYQEAGTEPLELARWPGSGGAFAYRDRAGDWSPVWPPNTGTAPPTPWLIRVETGQDFPPSLVALVAGSHEQVMRMEDMLGTGKPVQ